MDIQPRCTHTLTADNTFCGRLLVVKGAVAQHRTSNPKCNLSSLVTSFGAEMSIPPTGQPLRRGHTSAQVGVQCHKGNMMPRKDTQFAFNVCAFAQGGPLLNRGGK